MRQGKDGDRREVEYEGPDGRRGRALLDLDCRAEFQRSFSVRYHHATEQGLATSPYGAAEQGYRAWPRDLTGPAPGQPFMPGMGGSLGLPQVAGPMAWPFLPKGPVLPAAAEGVAQASTFSYPAGAYGPAGSAYRPLGEGWEMGGGAHWAAW